MLTFEQYLLEKKRLSGLCDLSENNLREFTKDKVSLSGLIVESVRQSDEYKTLRQNFIFHFCNLRDFNSSNKVYNKRLAEEKRKLKQR